MSVTSAAAGVVIDSGRTAMPESRHERGFDACSTALYRFFVVRTGDSHLADDLMQQLWLHMKRGAAGVPPDRIEFWLRAVARNLLRTHWRVRARRPGQAAIADPRLAAELAERLASAEIPPTELETREVREQLLLAITELTADEQDLIVGCYFEGLPHARLAERLGVSERAIEGRLYRARQALRMRLSTLEPD